MENRKTTRREALAMLGVTGLAVGVGCGSEDTLTSSSSTPTVTAGGTSGACAVAPTETRGPYPSLTDMVRSDIREGRSGLPLVLTLTVVNVNNACAPVSGAVVDIWQCDALGRYSEYAQPGYDGTGDTFLRGLQTTDASGRVTFTTIFPGWYAGRATHIHVEVTVNGQSVKVTQIAFPENVTAAVYGSGVYASKGQNPTPNSSDNVFSDSINSELATLSGDTTNGYTATFQLGVSI